MIGMMVRKDESIQGLNPALKALHAKLRAGIDLDMMPVHDDMNRSTRAPILRIIQITTPFRMRDHRHPLRSSCSHENQFHKNEQWQAQHDLQLRKHPVAKF